MEQDNSTVKLVTSASRRKRVKRIKILIVVLALLFLILPTIICIILLSKVNSLQKQIDVLMIDHYGVTYNELYRNQDGIAHAAVVDESKQTAWNPQKPEEDSSTENELPGESTDINKSEDKSTKNQSTKDQSSMDQNSNGIENTGKESENSTIINGKSKEKSIREHYDLDFAIDVNAMKSKKVYLTFDDGPSKYTGDILDILAKYNVKATFFVIGKTDEYSKSMYKRIVNEGHTLGIHSYSHQYSNLYNSLEDFDKDFTKLSDLLYDTTGYIPNIYRFPGGSGNNVSKVDISSIIHYLNKKDITYFDWNVENGDATGTPLTPRELYNNVMKGVNTNNTSIVLMHDTDTKENTVKSLDYILKALTELQTELLPLNNSVSPIQQIKAEQ